MAIKGVQQGTEHVAEGSRPGTAGHQVEGQKGQDNPGITCRQRAGHRHLTHMMLNLPLNYIYHLNSGLSGYLKKTLSPSTYMMNTLILDSLNPKLLLHCHYFECSIHCVCANAELTGYLSTETVKTLTDQIRDEEKDVFLRHVLVLG